MTDIEAMKAKLLREIGQNGDFAYPRNPDGPEAVAVIDALVEDNERLRGECLVVALAEIDTWVNVPQRSSMKRRMFIALKDTARD